VTKGGDATSGRRLHQLAFTRLLDIVVALIALVAIAPFLLLLAILIRVDSPGPVLYRSRRVGRAGCEFDMFKFRKMHDLAGGPPLTSWSDPRFTRCGVFLARTKLDELPQLLNVLRGEMSLVGPRPEDREFVSLHPEEFAEILAVRPGLSGLSQLAFAQERQSLDVADPLDLYKTHLLPEKLRIDRLYVEHASLRLDLRIMAWTLPAIAGIGVVVNCTNGHLAIHRQQPLPSPQAELEMAE
jgi:lipopolysaccharide/colanic/teichoic acid biosynthesis glycosyltransferase